MAAGDDVDRKPFDSADDAMVKGEQEDDLQPDPDESLMMDQGAGRVWAVKVRSGHINLVLLMFDVRACNTHTPNARFPAE